MPMLYAKWSVVSASRRVWEPGSRRSLAPEARAKFLGDPNMAVEEVVKVFCFSRGHQAQCRGGVINSKDYR